MEGDSAELTKYNYLLDVYVHLRPFTKPSTQAVAEQQQQQQQISDMASTPINLDAPHQLFVDGGSVHPGCLVTSVEGGHGVCTGARAVPAGSWCGGGCCVACGGVPDAPLDPTCGASPSSLLTTNTIMTLLLLADKYNMQGVLPHCRYALLSPRYRFAVSGINLDSCAADQLDAFEWIKIAEGVPGFDAVVSRCIQQIVLSATHINGRLDQGANTSRYSGHAMLMTSMSGLRPDTGAKVATSMASCLATLANMQGQGSGYHLQPSAQNECGWSYAWSR